MGKNDYLARRAAREQECFNAGARMGRQQMCDFISLALRDPDTMGKDTFSGKRIVRVMQRVNRLLDEFYPALSRGRRRTTTRRCWTSSCGRLTGTRSGRGSTDFTNGMRFSRNLTINRGAGNSAGT